MDKNRVHLPQEQVTDSVMRLLQYCQKHDWAGFDPYDALNSRVFAGTPLYQSRLCRLVFTQIMKRLPINLRPFLRVPQEHNPKALALFLQALLKLAQLRRLDDEAWISSMIARLVALRSPHTPYWCWGYSFPWQGRSILVPKGAPNLVCTSFVANALLDAYEMQGETRCLSMATSAAEYILHELYWTENDVLAGFSYPAPHVRVQVHNANFLGAALLCRIYKHAGGQEFLKAALKVVRYAVAQQHADGWWHYGELSTQRWIDNFHTGFNLCALRTIAHHTATQEFDDALRRGFAYYKAHFFLADNAPKYFHHRAYPLDSHSVAQSILTLLSCQDLDAEAQPEAFAVFTWAMQNMWHRQGYFYYQKHAWFSNKISYMRWSQAWMLLALTTLLEHCHTALQPSVELSQEGLTRYDHA